MIFHDLVIEIRPWSRFESSDRNVFPSVVWAVEMERDKFSGYIVDAHEMLTETVR